MATAPPSLDANVPPPSPESANGVSTKFNRLKLARNKLEVELEEHNKLILEAVEKQDRTTKIQNLIEKSNYHLSKLLSKNDELIATAATKNDKEDYNLYANNINTRTNEITTRARVYIDAQNYRKRPESLGNVSHSHASQMVSTKFQTASIASSQKIKEHKLAVKRREEEERQSEAKLRLKQKKQEIELRKLELQLELEELAEQNRAKLAEATLTEEQFLQDLVEHDSIRDLLNSPNLPEESVAGSQRTENWVHNTTEEMQLAPLTEPSPKAAGFEPSRFNPYVPSVTKATCNFAQPIRGKFNNLVQPLYPKTGTVTFESEVQSVPFDAHPSVPTVVPKCSDRLSQHHQVSINPVFVDSQNTSLTQSAQLVNLSPLNPIQPQTDAAQSQYPFHHGGTVFYPQGYANQTAPSSQFPAFGNFENGINHGTNPRASDRINYAQNPVDPSAERKSLTVEDLADLLTMNRKDPLPEWNLSKYDGDPLRWHEWFGQFESIIDSARLSDHVKLTYLKTLVTGKAKRAIAEFAYSGAMYQEALNTLKRKFGQPQTVVSAYLEKLSTFPNLKIHNSDNIINFASTISSLVGVFKSLSYFQDLEGVALLNQALSKLPPNMRESWALYTVKRNLYQPTLLHFNEWLGEKAEAHERMHANTPKARNNDSQAASNTAKTTTKVLVSNSKPSDKKPSQQYPPCLVCKGKHAIWSCSVFKEKTPTQRAKYAADQKLCFSCLQADHSFRNCPKARQCNKPDCKRTHNILLHGAERVYPSRDPPKPPPGVNSSSNSASLEVSKVDRSNSARQVQGTLQIVKLQLSHKGSSIECLVACDTGSTHSWISSELAKKLNLSGNKFGLSLNGINSQQVFTTEQVELTVSSLDALNSYTFKAKPFVKNDLSIGSGSVNLSELQAKYPHLDPLPSINYNYSDVGMILGQDCYHAMIPLEVHGDKTRKSPFAVRFPIGWALSGPLPPSSGFPSHCLKCTVEDLTLVEQVKNWYELESYGTYKSADPRSTSDKEAVKTLESTICHDGTRYSVGMLWVNKDIKLPNNYYSALAQLKSLEKRLEKDSDLKVLYNKTIQDDLDKNYIVPVSTKDLSIRTDREWYLPHHPVVNPNKPGKVRRVLNGASKFHGVSLNQSLMVGPDLLQNLLRVLLRFRQHKYAVSADIEGMFLQVGVIPQDQPSLRFLWREDPTSEVKVFQYTRHIFGARDSPTCANFALQQTARDNYEKFPAASAAVLDNFYMDDFLGSVVDKKEALNLSEELVKLLALGGFKLTKFISSVPGLANKLNSEPEEKDTIKEITLNVETTHVLGLKWDHESDTLNVSRGINKEIKKPITQRTVLSYVSSVFDPIGLVAPYTVRARLLLKDIWRVSGQQWDEPLSDELQEKFLEWHSGLSILGRLTIPRSFFDTPVENIELHMFGDSSMDVFCSVAFLRGRSIETNESQIAFVFGKARVAPMKMLSIPKLELQAALLASRLRIEIEKSLSIKIERSYMWTDSTTVLQWLNSTNKLPVFVANRVTEILETTTIDEWFHVSSGDNPADTGTRGITADALKESSWVKGPQFLRTSDWPFKPDLGVVANIRLRGPSYDLNEGIEHASNFAAVLETTKPFFAWNKYSSFTKLVNITAYVLRLLPRHRQFRSTRSIVDPSEIKIAEEQLLVMAQSESFHVEVKALQNKTKVKKSSRIASLSPFIGPGGIIRSTGRIRRLDAVEFNSKHPVVLDSRHPLVLLLLTRIHKSNHHQSIDYLRAVVQLDYAVLGLRSALRSIESHCLLCRKRKAKVIEPMMADLPSERLGYRQPPFANCGVDYFGPFHVTIRRSSEKRWGFLFTCMTTRAVHIEVVPSMDTSSCVMGIERFIARRGTPTVIWSDNGTNFVGSSKELLLCIANWNSLAPELLAHKNLTWKFNPPSAPHHGGVWERLVRSTKRVFYDILGNRKLTDEILVTTFCLVEQSLNNRPLTPVSSDPNDLEALTPNHFVLGHRSSSFPSLDFEQNFDHRKRYARAQSYANAIWTRWLREYVPALNKRAKWFSSPELILKTGDLVWMVEDNSPRGHYPLARVKSLNSGADGIARSAVVRTSTGEYTRPLVKLAPVLASSPLGAEDVNAYNMH